ncbi:uncharacterized protein LOC135075535 [Ostrinia nubilalis]|uniref:uncharacterized protein LOC135075535 n=1 Tax=Ostrinia nubilalis TaxID=29057 RepID=UPI0030823670
MTERKILLFILSVIAYGMYSVHMWFLKDNGENPDLKQEKPNLEDNKEIAIPSEPKVKEAPKQIIRRYIKDGCSVMQILTEKPKDNVKKILMEDMDNNGSAVTVIGITVFLLVLTVNAILDVLKVKEEERARLKLNPEGERRQSLAEFANKKPLRRESSKFGLHLFQISETVASSGEEKKDKKTRQTRPYTRGDSTNSYLSERKPKSEGSAPASISETSTAEPRLAKRQSVAKLIGGRPVPMVRRSSFPALPLNPEVQALMLGHRQASVDSDDEDGRGRRVRIIRRY